MGDHGQFVDQTVTDITVDFAGYAYGRWNGKKVASFHVDNGYWYVID